MTSSEVDDAAQSHQPVGDEQNDDGQQNEAA
jgi:hypothetical protein